MITVTADSATSTEDGAGAVTGPSSGLTFEQLVAQHQSRVARLAQRLLGWRDADVQDVVQEVFVCAWAHLASFRGESSIETWLTRLTINQCRSHRRRRLARVSLLARFVHKRPPAG